MARTVKIQASAEDVAKALQDKGEFVLPPVGYYVLKVVEANAGFSKDKEGDEDPKRPYIELVYDFVAKGAERAELEANYGRIWDYVTFSKEAGWKRAEFMRAFYPEQVSDGEEINASIDLDEIIEREVFARIKHEKDKLKSAEEKKTVMRARIARTLPLDSADEFSAAEAGADAYSDAEDSKEANPFEEGGEDALLTEEELGAMDLKELGAVAKEFDLTPEDFIVLNRAKKVDADKTKAALIAAIMAAQDGGEPSAEEGSDESPF